MYRMIKADLDEREINNLGFESMWNTSSGKNKIIEEVEKLDGEQIVETLESNLDSNSFKKVMLQIASGLFNYC